jgi:hypothetical protein
MKINIPLLFLTMLLLTSFTNVSKNEMTIDNVTFIQENYSRNDLFFIMGISSDIDFGFSCTWKISKEELNKQKEITLDELIKEINIDNLIQNGNYFINNYFNGGYINNMYFYSISFDIVNVEKYGDDRNIKRNDWIIELSYLTYDGDFNEKVFVLPDERIIISSNNFEGIEF